jgi:hypothetical protein
VLRYYRDGVFLEQATRSAGAAVSFDSLFNDTSSESFHGDVEFVHVWDNRLLSDGEIYDQFVNPYAIYEPSLLTNTTYHFPVAGGVFTPYFYREHIAQAAA